MNASTPNKSGGGLLGLWRRRVSSSRGAGQQGPRKGSRSGLSMALLVPLVAANGLLILLTLGGLVARYVPPHRGWWLQVLAVALPAFGGGLLVAALVVVREHAWWAALNLALALVVVARTVSVGSFFGADADRPTLSVITYNAGGLANQVPDHVEELYEAFRTADPDVVAWQEQQTYVPNTAPDKIVAPGRFRNIFAMLQHRLPPLPPQEKLVRNPVTTSLDASSLEVVAVSDLDREQNPGSATRVEMEWEGRPFAVYSVHLHSFSRRPKPGSRRAWLHPATWKETLYAMRANFLLQEEEAVRLRRRLQEEPLPYILCGDFNSTPNNWAYAYLASGLTDAFAEEGWGLGTTFSARRPWVRIDYVLASPEWEVESARVLRVRSSDHLPVWARLRWR